ncbi:MAG: tetratricopeptide repeat protein [Melioribacteraceae bacterium]|nr:tetratricopeptide repeat protein [Melioribacteraceae bacterium]
MLNKKYSILIILIILHLSPVAAEVLAQSKGNGTDSLFEKLNTPDLKTKLQAYIDLIKYYNKIKPEKSISYSEEALKLARDNNFKQEEGMILFLTGVSYHSRSLYHQAMENYQLAFEIRKSINDKVGIGESLNRISFIYNVRGEYEKALDYCLQSIKILENENDKKALARSYNNLGIIYYILRDIQKAEELSIKALEFSRQVNDDLILANSHEHLGIIYIYKQEYDKATYQINKSIELRLPENDKSGLAGSYENLAIINRRMEKYDDALRYYNKSIEFKKEINSIRGVASSITGIGLTYSAMGDYEKSLNYLKHALDIRNQLGDKRGIVASLNRLADLYSKMKEYRSAYEHLKMAKNKNDSLLSENKNRAVAELQELFDHERKEQEIILLQKENTIQKYFRNSLLIITILLSGIAITAIIAYRTKRKVNSILTKQNDEIVAQKEELQLLNNELKEVVSSKDKFFSIIAHDLKSPFQGLLSSADFVSTNYSELTDEERISLLNGMRELSHNSYKLVDNLLEWAKIQTGKLEYNPEKINLLFELHGTLFLAKKAPQLRE